MRSAVPERIKQGTQERIAAGMNGDEAKRTPRRILLTG